MTISPVQNQQLNMNDQPKIAKKELSPDDFITLFLKQMTTQNPMHPADSGAILQQMADISAISAAKDTQKTLREVQQNVKMSLGNTQFLTATQLIGKKVEVPSGISPLIKDEGLSGSVWMPAAGHDIKVTIKNEKGETVKVMTLDPTSSEGLVEFHWNGLKDEVPPTACEPGYYKITATANVNDKEVSIDTLGAFKINSVGSNAATGDVILNIDGLGGLGLKDIIKIL